MKKKSLTLYEALQELESINHESNRIGRTALISGSSGTFPSYGAFNQVVDNFLVDRKNRSAKLKNKK